MLKKLFLFVLFCHSLYSEPFYEIAEKLKKRIRKFELENGLRVILMQNSTSPTVALYTKFLVGSVDETPEIAGTAHLLEHMLFKGTIHIGTNDWENEKKFYALLKATGSELDNLKLEERYLKEKNQEIPEKLSKRIQQLSRRLQAIEEQQKKYIIKSEDTYIYEQHGQVGFNAYTTHDVTNYQIKLPANRIEIWAKLESDRLLSPVLREYYTERNVIMEERRMRVENRGFGLLLEKFISLAFDESPYGRPVIGYASNIPFLDIYETENFFKTYYTPENMVIGIVGDIDFEKTERLVRKYFSPLKAQTTKRKKHRVQELFHKGEKRFQFEYPGGSILMLGFHKPAVPSKEDAAFTIIDSILTQGVGSRMYQSVVLKEQLCTQISAWTTYPGERFSNLFTIIAYLNSDAKPEKLEELIWKELERLKNGEITNEEISRAKDKITADFLRQIDSNSTLADSLTYYELLLNNWEELFSGYDRLSSITKEEIIEVSKKYFQKSNSILGVLVGKQQ